MLSSNVVISLTKVINCPDIATNFSGFFHNPQQEPLGVRVAGSARTASSGIAFRTDMYGLRAVRALSGDLHRFCHIAGIFAASRAARSAASAPHRYATRIPPGFSHFDFVLNTPARHNPPAGRRFCPAYPDLWLRRRYSVSAESSCRLLLLSTFRIFAFVEDTPSRQSANKFAFALSLFVSLAAPKILRLGRIKLSLASALDFSYLCPSVRPERRTNACNLFRRPCRQPPFCSPLRVMPPSCSP